MNYIFKWVVKIWLGLTLSSDKNNYEQRILIKIAYIVGKKNYDVCANGQPELTQDFVVCVNVFLKISKQLKITKLHRAIASILQHYKHINTVYCKYPQA